MHLLLNFNYCIKLCNFNKARSYSYKDLNRSEWKGTHIFFIFFFFNVDLFVHLENEQSDFKFVLLETEQLVHFNSLDSKSLWDMNLHKSWWYIWNFDIIWSYVALSATKCGFTRMRIEFVVVVASLTDVSQKRFSNTHLFLLVT